MNSVCPLLKGSLQKSDNISFVFSKLNELGLQLCIPLFESPCKRIEVESYFVIKPVPNSLIFSENQNIEYFAVVVGDLEGAAQ